MVRMFLLPFFYEPVILQVPMSLIVVFLLTIFFLVLPLLWFYYDMEMLKEKGQERVDADPQTEAEVIRCEQHDKAVHTEAPESVGDEEN